MAGIALKVSRTIKIGRSSKPTYCIATLILSDILALSLAWLIAVTVRFLFGGVYTLSFYFRLWPALFLFIGAFALRRLYHASGIVAVHEFKAIAIATSMVFANLIVFSFLEGNTQAYSRLVFMGAWALSITTLISFRLLIRSWLSDRAWWGTPAIVLGSSVKAAEVVRLLKGTAGTGIRIIGVLADTVTERLIEGVPVLGNLSAAADVAQQTCVPIAIFAASDGGSLPLPELVRRHGKYFPNLIIVPPILSVANLWVQPRGIGRHLTFEIRQDLLMLGPRMCKRALDLLLAACIGTVMLPVIALIAVLVKLTSPGPVFYGQPRIGRHRKQFRAWKFRTMVRDADRVLAAYLKRDSALRLEWERDHKLKNDPRVNWFGRLLRRSSLDELPQLWNVFRGDMSLVGPRPIVAAEVEKYADWFDEYCRVLPGITGLWQVSGRNDTTYQERVWMDAYYTHNWSLWLDLFLLIRTFGVVLRRRGAY